MSRPLVAFTFRVTGLVAGKRVRLGLTTARADTWFLARAQAQRDAVELYACDAVREVEVERLVIADPPRCEHCAGHHATEICAERRRRAA